MSTKPTLYVNDPKRHTLRIAAHDDLIAAMPRCGTCRKPTPDGWCEVVVLNINYHNMHERFGCTDHEERES